jgi:molecular chaperone GrpE
MAFFKTKKNMNENKQHQEKATEAMDTKATVNIEEQMEATEVEENTKTIEEEVEVESNQTLDKVNAELAEMKDKYLRLMAEFDNAKRRNAREQNDIRQTAGKDVIQSLLVILDDMERASKQMETADNLDAVKEGTILVFNKFRNILLQKGLKKMDSLQEEFDVELHEAITEIPAPDSSLVGKVLDEIEPGYYLNDKIIRHAKVVVGK